MYTLNQSLLLIESILQGIQVTLDIDFSINALENPKLVNTHTAHIILYTLKSQIRDVLICIFSPGISKSNSVQSIELLTFLGCKFAL